CTPAKPLMVWAVKQALQKTKQLLTEGGYVGSENVLYEAVLDEILTKAKKADDDALTAAGDVGHAAHEWIEQVIKTILTKKDNRRQELFAKLPEDEGASNASVASVGWMVE